MNVKTNENENGNNRKNLLGIPGGADASGDCVLASDPYPVPAMKPLVVQCAWCRQFKVDGAWQVEAPAITAQDHDVTHGICPGCGAAWGK